MTRSLAILSAILLLSPTISYVERDPCGPCFPIPVLQDSAAFAAGAPTFNVVARPDNSRAVSKSIPVGGGKMGAVASDGTRYTLTFPQGALLEETKVTMTPVSKIDGLSLSGKTRTAITLEPEGLVLFNGATLLIEPSTPVLLKEQISFAFEGSGEKLHLYPLTENPKAIAFNIIHFSGYGMGQGSAADTRTLSSYSKYSGESRFTEAMYREIDDIRNGRDQEKSSADAQAALTEWFEKEVYPEMQAAEKRALTCDEFDDLAKRSYICFSWMLKVGGLGESNMANMDKYNDSLAKILLKTYSHAVDSCDIDCMRHSVAMSIRGIGGDDLAVNHDSRVFTPQAKDICRKKEPKRDFWIGTVTLTKKEDRNRHIDDKSHTGHANAKGDGRLISDADYHYLLAATITGKQNPDSSASWVGFSAVVHYSVKDVRSSKNTQPIWCRGGGTSEIFDSESFKKTQTADGTARAQFSVYFQDVSWHVSTDIFTKDVKCASVTEKSETRERNGGCNGPQQPISNTKEPVVEPCVVGNIVARFETQSTDPWALTMDGTVPVELPTKSKPHNLPPEEIIEEETFSKEYTATYHLRRIVEY